MIRFWKNGETRELVHFWNFKSNILMTNFLKYRKMDLSQPAFMTFSKELSSIKNEKSSPTCYNAF